MSDEQHILIVDDRRDNLIALERVLRETNARVTSVMSGNEALIATLRQDFALAILDVQMPEMDGFELAELLRAEDKTRHLPIIFMSAVYSDDYHVFRGYAAGAVDFLTKPYKLEILLNKVEFFLLLDKQRQALEEKLAIERSKNYLESILTSMTDSVVVVSRDLRIQTANRATRELLGYDEAELIDTPLDNLFPDHTLPAELTIEGDARSKRKFHRDDLELQTKSGDRVPVLLNVSFLRDQNFGATGIVLVAIDNTERKRAEKHRSELEAQLRHSQRLESIGRLAGGVAHDFNNLLTVILSCSSFIAAGLRDDDPHHADIADILEASQRGQSLVRQLLAFSHKQVLRPDVLDLNEVVTRTARMLERTLSEDVEINLQLTSGLDPIFVDPSQLTRVLINLGVNARDAMPHGGTLTFTTASAAPPMTGSADLVATYDGDQNDLGWVRLTVLDTGCGIKESMTDRIFEPFFTTKEEGQGTGLGLSVVHGIVEQSGGHISVTSVSSEGTTFSIYLPTITKHHHPSTTPTIITSPESGTETVLVVEDNDTVRKLTIRILRRHGYNALEARTLQEAINLAASRPRIDLLLTDVVMPGSSGPKVAEALLKLYPDLPVLFMSGHAHDTLQRHDITMNRTAFLQKPFSPSTLTNKIRETLHPR